MMALQGKLATDCWLLKLNQAGSHSVIGDPVPELCRHGRLLANASSSASSAASTAATICSTEFLSLRSTAGSPY